MSSSGDGPGRRSVIRRLSGAGQEGQPEDRALLAAHLEGDPEAFGLLFARHRDRLWAVALRTLGDPEEAADALQDAMVSAFRRADGYRGDAAVTTWLHRIVVNACLDRVRRGRVRRAEPLAEDADGGVPGMVTGSAGLEVTPSPSPDPAEAAERHERQRAVLSALDALPVEQRSAVVLVDMEGLSVDEAARLLGVPAGTVKSRCARGRARLRPLLAELGVLEQPPGNRSTGLGVPSDERRSETRRTGRSGGEA